MYEQEFIEGLGISLPEIEDAANRTAELVEQYVENHSPVSVIDEILSVFWEDLGV